MKYWSLSGRMEERMMLLSWNAFFLQYPNVLPPTFSHWRFTLPLILRPALERQVLVYNIKIHVCCVRQERNQIHSMRSCTKIGNTLHQGLVRPSTSLGRLLRVGVYLWSFELRGYAGLVFNKVGIPASTEALSKPTLCCSSVLIVTFLLSCGPWTRGSTSLARMALQRHLASKKRRVHQPRPSAGKSVSKGQMKS